MTLVTSCAGGEPRPTESIEVPATATYSGTFSGAGGDLPLSGTATYQTRTPFTTGAFLLELKPSWQYGTRIYLESYVGRPGEGVHAVGPATLTATQPFLVIHGEAGTLYSGDWESDGTLGTLTLTRSTTMAVTGTLVARVRSLSFPERGTTTLSLTFDAKCVAYFETQPPCD